MKSQIFSRALLGALVLLGSTVGTFATMNANAALGEVFICDWNDGQGMDELMQARDYYVRQAERAGITLPPAFVWTPVHVGPGTPELLWFQYYENGTQYGEFGEAMAAADEMNDVQARFDRVGTCRSGLFTQEPVYVGSKMDTLNPPSYVVSSACNFRSGRIDQVALDDFKNHLAGVLGSSGNYENYAIYTRQSVTRSPDTPHVRFFSVHDNALDWGRRQDAFPSIEGAAMLGRHFNDLFDCSQSHWMGQNVIAAPGN
jgi:hypothetical protein